MRKLQIGSIEIDVIRKDIKNMHLAVYPPTGRVRLATPLHMREETIRLFAVSRMLWIKKQQKQFREQIRESKREYISGESHYLFGKRYILRIHEQTKRTEIKTSAKFIDFHISKRKSNATKKHTFEQFCRNTLRAAAEPILAKWQEKLGVKSAQLEIRKMKTMWGTAQPRAERITLNLELAKKPIKCIEYIIVHELLHFKERHHNAHFLEMMSDAMPMWKERRAELNRLPVSHRDWEY